MTFLPWFPWWGWLLVLAAVPVGMLAWALTRLHRWRERHHGYWGLMLFAAGWYGMTHARHGSTVAACTLGALVGYWWLWDDAEAHSRQARDQNFPRSGPRAVLDRKYSLVHRIAHRIGLI